MGEEVNCVSPQK